MSGKRKLTQEEAKLWQRTIANDKPLHADKSETFKKALEDMVVPPSEPKKSVAPATRSGRIGTNSTSRQPQSGSNTNDISFQRHEVRRLQSGSHPIDQRIDLHGLNQMQARGRLLTFLKRAQAQGAHYVLVITGKGGRERQRQDDLALPWQEERTGILKSAVPDWFNEPEFQSCVVRWTQAGHGHGGEGALYVHIRRISRKR